MTDLERAVVSDWVVISDLDGTLLDHDTYSFSAARPALARLARSGIPLVLATSKTLAEVKAIRALLAVEGPVIAENGALVEFPASWTRGARTLQRFSPAYPDLVALLATLKEQHGFNFPGFHDLGPQGVAELTGLTPEQASLACEREGSEPILWQDSPEALQTFTRLLADRRLKLLQGGRFQHVVGIEADKARAVESILAILMAAGWRGRSIALGDAPNDHGMLCAADIPIIVRNPHAARMPPIPSPRLLRTAHTGPEGWREAIEAILESPQGEVR